MIGWNTDSSPYSVSYGGTRPRAVWPKSRSKDDLRASTSVTEARPRTSGARFDPWTWSSHATASASAAIASTEARRVTVSSVGGPNPSARASYMALRHSATSRGSSAGPARATHRPGGGGGGGETPLPGLDRVGMFRGPHVDGLLHRGPEELLAIPPVGDDRVVVERDAPTAQRRLIDLGPLLDLVAVDDQVGSAEELEHGEE